MSYVTGISGNVISAASAGWAPTNSAEVSAIASAYATGGAQVVTSLQYATSESATVATTVTADTAVGNGARDISAEYYDYGYGSWIEYDSSKPLVQVRMTAVGNMTNYSSNPYYLYVVPYGATNDGNVSNTGDLTGALAYGEFSGGMHDFIVAEGTASSIEPYKVGVTFDVTHVPFWGSEPAWWGTVTGERYGVVDSDVYSRPVFCVAGGNYGSELFEVRSNITAELDFGSVVTVSAVSGINELEIAGAGGGIDSATVSAIASSYARDVSAAASGAVSAVSSNSADWMKLSSCFSGIDGIVTAVGSSNMFTPATASSFMGVGSAFQPTTGSFEGSEGYVNYPLGIYLNHGTVKFSASDYMTFAKFTQSAGNIVVAQLGLTDSIKDVCGDVDVYSTDGAFTLNYTANSVEPLAFQNDLPYYSYDSNSAISAINGSAIGGAGGVNSATVSAIASSYAESAVSGKADSSALSSYALSSDVSGTVDLVSTQSANWGGSALALSAGPGVKLEKVGDTLVASTDETVLWSGSGNAFTTTEPLTNFSEIKFHVKSHASANVGEVVVPMVDNNRTAIKLSWADDWSKGTDWMGGLLWWANLNNTDMTNFVIGSAYYFGLRNGATFGGGSYGSNIYVLDVIGVGRTAEA